MKALKLATLSSAVVAGSAFAAPVVVDQQPVVVAQPVAVAQPVDATPVVVDQQVVTQPVGVSTTTYNPATGVVQNTTTQIVEAPRTALDTFFHPASFGIEAGTLGYGANIGWSVNENTELVAGWAGGDVKGLLGDDFTARGVKYKYDKADFNNPYVGVQMRPGASWFTVGAGVLVPDNDFKVKTDNNKGTIKVGGDKYKITEGQLVGELDHRNDLAPYLTLGFRPNLNNNWGVFGEIGGAYMGKADVKVTPTNGTVVVNEKTGLRGNADDVARQAEADIRDKNVAEWLPIVKLGVSYRF